MKFNVSSKTFYGYVSAVNKIINAKNALTILNNFKLELRDNELTIVASDGENFLEGHMAVQEAEGEGVACIDARRLTDLLKELPEVGIEVEIDVEGGTYAFTVKYADAEYDFMGFDGNDYPTPKAPTGVEATPLEFVAPASRLVKGVDNTIFAVGTDELRPQMMGIYWDVKPDELVFVATDTRKLVKYSDKTISAGASCSFIMPVKSMSVLKSVFMKQDDVKIIVEERGVRFETPDFVFSSLKLKGSFPDYNRVIPSNNPYTLTVDRPSLQSAVRRIGAFCDAGNGLVRFKITEDKMILKASESSYNSKAWESTPCSFTGTDLVIGFSAPYVSEILSTLGSRDVVVKLSDPSRPGVFMPSENEENTELLMLLMPMLVAEF